MLFNVISPSRTREFLGVALLLALAPAACHRGEQAVQGVAQTAVNAEKKAQATATVRDAQRAQLEQIPLPTKSLYVNIHEPGAWENPFLSVGADMLTLRIAPAAAAPSPTGKGATPRTEAARRREIQLHPGDLAKAIIAIPPAAWRYGRVIAVVESPQTNPKDRTMVRRNVETAIQQLNDMGIVVQEWPSK
jgi:hypothetical protein